MIVVRIVERRGAAVLAQAVGREDMPVVSWMIAVKVHDSSVLVACAQGSMNGAVAAFLAALDWNSARLGIDDLAFATGVVEGLEQSLLVDEVIAIKEDASTDAKVVDASLVGFGGQIENVSGGFVEVSDRIEVCLRNMRDGDMRLLAVARRAAETLVGKLYWHSSARACFDRGAKIVRFDGWDRVLFNSVDSVLIVLVFFVFVVFVDSVGDSRGTRRARLETRLVVFDPNIWISSSGASNTSSPA